MTEGSSGPGDFRRARTAAGLLLVGLVVILAVLDASSREFSIDSVQLGIMLGTALLFLGVEAGRKLFR